MEEGATVTRYPVRMAVTLKPEVLDPAGQATLAVIKERGFGMVDELRIGKLVDFSVQARDPAEALEVARRLGREFLANPVLEQFDVWMDEAQSPRTVRDGE